VSEEQCRSLVAAVRRGVAPMTMDVREQQRAIMQDLDPSTDRARVDWMLARIIDVPNLIMAKPVEVGIEAIHHPTCFVACSRTPLPQSRAVAAELGWPIYEIDSDHALMVTHPEETARLLDDIALR
jgi:hypothetical protein